ncbi:unnamed protein product [Tenebrio molitor]|nr:unnamed protein product [Tenebrio molitor]
MDSETPSPSCSTSSDDSSSKPNNRLGSCEVCSKQNARYCCPRCEIKTCSLNCNRIHKLEVECNGIRDKTKFIPINKFTNLDLASDYRLLEETTRVVEVSKKGRSGLGFPLNKRFRRLEKEALKRKMVLKFLPKTFVRHKNNSTYFNIEKELIEWHVEWIFVNSENFKISENNVPENVRLSLLLDKYLSKQEEVELQEKLQYYQSADLPGIKILLQAEQKSGKKFYELDPTFTLKDCLKNKIIIEYPVIHLVLKDHGNCYDIVDSDDEDCKREVQNRGKSGEEVINKIIKRAESDGSLYDSFRNLMFATEGSNEDSD